MKRQSLLLLFAGSLLFLASLPVEAQTTGQIRGTVVDSDGAVIPGVTVTIQGENLMGGTRDALTGDAGGFRFGALPPGLYTMTAEMDSFEPSVLENVQVRINATADANFVLYLAGFTEAVTVSSEAPLVDVTSSSAGNSFTADFIKDLPTDRNFYSLLSVSPGVATSAEDSDRQIAFGSNEQSNAWHIDGLEASAPETGTAWIYVNPDMVEEIQVLGVGAPAQFGNMLGAAFNVVTKSGTNELEGTVNAYFQDDALTDSSYDIDTSGMSEFEQERFREFPDFTRDRFWDITGTLGGPIMKDKLWFFGAYENYQDQFTYPGVDPAFPTDFSREMVDLKFSFKVNEKNVIDVKGHYSDWGYIYPNAFQEPPSWYSEIGDDVGWGLNWQSIISDRDYLEFRYSGWKTNDDYVSLFPTDQPPFIDYSPPGGGPPTYAGAAWFPFLYETGTDQIDATYSHFVDDFLGGEHDFKFGVRYGDGFSDSKGQLNGVYYYRYVYEYDYYGTIYPYEYFYKVEYAPLYYGNDQTALSVYVDDSFRISGRLTLNLGLRFDRHEGSIPSYPAFGRDLQPTGEINPAIDPVFTWNNWSPRIGFAYNLGANYNTVVRGSFGIYYDGNVGGNWNYPPPNAPEFEYFFSSSPDGPWESFSVFDYGPNNVDPDLKAPRTVQYSLGFEQAFKANYSFGVMGVWKDTRDLVGFEILNDGVYEAFPFTDPFSGREYSLLSAIELPSVRKGNRPGYTAAGFQDEYWQDYWGIVLSFNRRMTDWWSLQSSYTLSESNGLIPRMFSQTQFNPPFGSLEGSDPNNYINLENGQNLQGDRRNMFRVQGNFELPWNLHTSTSVNLQDGRPYARVIRVFGLEQGSTRVIMEPASDGQRHGFQALIDFTFGKRFELGSDTLLKLDLQVFNLLNGDATDLWETNVLQDGDVFIPNAFLKPRRLMLRAGVEF